MKRQELFENLNPLLKKYKYDGPQPPSYIPPAKRRKIQRYMDRSSYIPASFGGKYRVNFLDLFIQNGPNLLPFLVRIDQEKEKNTGRDVFERDAF